MSSQTYRYFRGKPLYPFGYGLSYTTFSYDKLEVEQNHSVGEPLQLSVTVKNTGQLAGDEVVQVYVSHKNAPVTVPLRSLKAFKRIHLQAGEAQTLNFTLPAEAFSVINNENDRVILPGEFEISVGGGQPDEKTTTAVLKTQVMLQ